MKGITASQVPAPVGCLEDKPTAQSVSFGGKFINLSAISRSQNIDHSYLSRIFAGNRLPTIPYARKLSAALGMSLDDFMNAIEERRNMIQQKNTKLETQYTERIVEENEQDLHSIRLGKPVKPRMPGTRLKEHTD